jgi:dipeptidyl-peptidase-4
MRSLSLLALVALFSLAGAEDEEPELLTVAERTNWEATSRHAEVMEFCQKLAAQSPNVYVTSIGKSKEGRDLPLLVIANPPIKTPAEAKQTGKAVVMAFANIHAGEVEGKEALQMLARELALPKPHPLLDKLVILLNPIFNADGNEKIDPKNRTHQGGPAGGVGVRANADGMDLNRDFVKLRSAEAQAMVKCWNEWDPLLIVDCHSTNGSYHRYLITYDGPRHPAADGAIRQQTGKALLPGVTTRLKKLGGWESFYYGTFNQDRSAWNSYPPLPRFAIQCASVRNRFGILSEAYTYAPFKDRVRATRDVAEHATELKKLCAEADARAAAAGEPLVLRYRTAPCEGRFNILGYVEERREGERRGRPTDQPREYPCVYLGACEPTLTVTRPHSYLIPPDQAATLEVLRKHGITVTELKEAREANIERFMIAKVKTENNPFLGGKQVLVEGEWKPDKATIHPGWFEVKAGQRLGNLACFILEAQADDGVVAWDLLGEVIAEGKAYPVLRRVK